ncbi:MAG: glycine cleavage system protein GcvH [Caulobacteraceae bacterium]|nr:glycine cleavage system protein GcvH [Caulobacteraceae bacterium]
MTKRYTKDHEWVELNGDIATVGISTYAAEQLGDVVYAELPDAGKSFKQGDDMAVVESAKTASDVYAPISGEVVEANAEIKSEQWQIINDAPQAGGWFVKLKIADKSELDSLMDQAAYDDYVKGLYVSGYFLALAGSRGPEGGMGDSGGSAEARGGGTV